MEFGRQNTRRNGKQPCEQTLDWQSNTICRSETVSGFIIVSQNFQARKRKINVKKSKIDDGRGSGRETRLSSGRVDYFDAEQTQSRRKADADADANADQGRVRCVARFTLRTIGDSFDRSC